MTALPTSPMARAASGATSWSGLLSKRRSAVQDSFSPSFSPTVGLGRVHARVHVAGVVLFESPFANAVYTGWRSLAQLRGRAADCKASSLNRTEIFEVFRSYTDERRLVCHHRTSGCDECLRHTYAAEESTVHMSRVSRRRFHRWRGTLD